jgi:hypothetical protein
MTRANRAAAFLLVLPSCWWLAQVVPRLLYHRADAPAPLETIYALGIVLAERVSAHTGLWLGPSDAVGLQDFLVALVLSAVAVFALNRARGAWARRWTRVGVMLASLLLPWSVTVLPFDDAEPHAMILIVLAVAYLGAVGVALLAPVTSRISRALFAVAFACGVVVLRWALEPWQWRDAGSALASLLLLAYSAARRNPTPGPAA